MREPIVIGNATLYLGDCREILPMLGKVDAVVTDPPYGIGFAAAPTKWQRRAGHEAKAWDDATIPDVVLALPEIAPCVIWGGNCYMLPQRRGWLTWRKPDAPPSMGQFELAWLSDDRTSREITVSIGETNPERVGHPTQKPLRVMEWSLGFVPDGLTLDPFIGSGTTGVACMNLGRKFIGIEIEPKYFDIACRRIEDAQRQGRLVA
jgi:site-specific DNA-methyltransferase (adenine-specific)/modification methylase